MSETIFMIHGMWAGSWVFEKYAPFFEERGYKCVAVDMLYHDVDPKAPPVPELGTTGLQDFADHLEEQIRKLPEPPIIMGHSMGGLLTQILAARGLGKAYVLLTPGFPSGIMGLRWSVIRSMWEVLLLWGFWRKPFRPSFDSMVYSAFQNTPVDEQRRFFDRMVYDSGRAVFEIGFWLFDRGKGSAVDEAKVTAPMLVIGAGRDRTMPAAAVRDVAAKYAHVSEYHEFPEMAHNVMGEQGWEQVAGYAHDWLKKKGL
ncbi:MAG: alpha/beta hydrolase [Nitrospinota bacterium]|nr:alpha/beta hydrolase [Nitrospinota bacterium]